MKPYNSRVSLSEKKGDNFENGEEKRNDVVFGRNAVSELLKTDRPIECIYIQKGELRGSITKIAAIAKERSIPVKEVQPQKLESLAMSQNHQGVAALAAAYAYSELDDILKRCENKQALIIIADSIEDPHNLGAIIRTAEAAGADGIIIPKRNSAGLTGTVAKTSAGAIEHIPVARVANLTDAIKKLKQHGIWVYAADMGGASWCQTDFKGSVALVIGSEGSGVSRLVKENCDFIVSLPMCGKINSLNASVAAGGIKVSL